MPVGGGLRIDTIAFGVHFDERISIYVVGDGESAMIMGLRMEVGQEGLGRSVLGRRRGKRGLGIGNQRNAWTDSVNTA